MTEPASAAECLNHGGDLPLRPVPVNTQPAPQYANNRCRFQGSPNIKRADNGRLWAAWYSGGTGEGPEGYVRAVTSGNDGRSWLGGLMLDERPAVSYPDGVRAPDSALYVVYDHDRTGAKEILLAVFSEADVLAGRCVSPAARLRVLVNQVTGQ